METGNERRAGFCEGVRGQRGLTVAEITALRTVLLHERLPSLAEAEPSPRVADSLLIQTTCRATDVSSHLNTTNTRHMMQQRVSACLHQGMFISDRSEQFPLSPP